MEIQGHRGSSDRYPENTLLAYRMAVQEGADGVEADVRRTRDGCFVMLHDATLDRTTSLSGPVANLSYREIAEVDAGGWKDSTFAGRLDTRIPTLAAVLETFRGSGADIILQLKLAVEDALIVASHVARRSMMEECTFFAPVPIINAIKRKYPEATTQNDGMPGRLAAMGVDYVLGNDCAAMVTAATKGLGTVRGNVDP